MKPGARELAELIRELEKWLVDRGLEVLPDIEAGDVTQASGLEREEVAERADLMVVLGGGGTLLAVSRTLAGRAAPILSVNLGTLGFLAEIAPEDLFPTLEDVLAGRFRIEERMRFEVTAERAGQQLGEFTALNDAVVASTALSRMVHLQAYADGAEVTTYHGDGLIVATPTGSTAYSLSAGGPLLLATAAAIVLTPISPHALTQRPLVLPATCVVEVHVVDTRGGGVQLTVDGQVGRALEGVDVVRVRRGAHATRLLVPHDRNRFQVMRTKLRWGER